MVAQTLRGDCDRNLRNPIRVGVPHRRKIIGLVSRLQSFLYDGLTQLIATVFHLAATIVDQDRSGSRQHIVRVLHGTPLPASSQVSARFAFRWCPWMYGEIRGCCRRYCRQRLGAHDCAPAAAAWCRCSGTLLPRARLGTDESADGLLVQLVAALGTVSGDPTGQLVRGVQRA